LIRYVNVFIVDSCASETHCEKAIAPLMLVRLRSLGEERERVPPDM
jgi:hypothetical protein